MIIELFTVLTIWTNFYPNQSLSTLQGYNNSQLLSAIAPTDIPHFSPQVFIKSPGINNEELEKANYQESVANSPQPAQSFASGGPSEVTPLPKQSDKPDSSTVPSITPIASTSELPTNEPTPTPIATTFDTPQPTATVTPEVTITPSPTPTTSPTPTVQSYNITGTEMDALFTEYSQKYNVDRDQLKRIAVCESHLNTNALNKAYGYGGLYQFSSTSWQGYRKLLNLDTNPDLRFNPEEAIKTAAWMLSTNRANAWPNCK